MFKYCEFSRLTLQNFAANNPDLFISTENRKQRTKVTSVSIVCFLITGRDRHSADIFAFSASYRKSYLLETGVLPDTPAVHPCSLHSYVHRKSKGQTILSSILRVWFRVAPPDLLPLHVAYKQTP